MLVLNRNPKQEIIFDIENYVRQLVKELSPGEMIQCPPLVIKVIKVKPNSAVLGIDGDPRIEIARPEARKLSERMEKLIEDRKRQLLASVE